ncbi:formyltransferase family protein [Desulfogranum mediterraneum]|uniref:formyltransferase family protein n=1 Tax=Desulfogranum mediterraneum TaxID=160661 RepID=UPI00040B0F61|nr:formyltransferase family protein [Desulfogranum mediterraneum]
MISSEKGNVLFLGERGNPLLVWLKNNGERVLQYSDVVNPKFILKNNVFFIVSYGYRYILRREVLEMMPSRAVNLHISYLPWNRGADPNFWSFVDDTPKGVTIHYIDEGVDTGDVIVQKKVDFDFSIETLASSYRVLQLEIQKLFIENWSEIKLGRCKREKQNGVGSMHRKKDIEGYDYLLTDGWDTSLSCLVDTIAWKDK